MADFGTVISTDTTASELTAFAINLIPMDYGTVISPDAGEAETEPAQITGQIWPRGQGA